MREQPDVALLVVPPIRAQGFHHARMATLGWLQNSVETEALARFAVDEHNKKQNCKVKIV
ncbi:hypothetical protein CR513_52904, partial [Mucuna pruriens]